MVAIVMSGVIGRFIYIQIPRSIQGQELSIKEINEINDDLTFKLRTEIKIDENFLLKLDDMASINKYKNLSTINGLVIIFTGYFHTKSLIHRLKKEIKSKHHQENISQIIRIVKIKLILSRRIGLLRTMQNLFKYWHVIHLPVAMVMFVIMMIHIIVAITFGYRWIF